jgi:hypothetical protein
VVLERLDLYRYKNAAGASQRREVRVSWQANF